LDEKRAGSFAAARSVVNILEMARNPLNQQDSTTSLKVPTSAARAVAGPFDRSVADAALPLIRNAARARPYQAPAFQGF